MDVWPITSSGVWQNYKSAGWKASLVHEEQTSSENYLKSNYVVILHIEPIMRNRGRGSVSATGTAEATVFVWFLNEYLTR